MPEYISEETIAGDCAPEAGPMEHMVTMTKVDGSTIGLRLLVDGCALRVTKVCDEGLMSNWNKDNPTHQVRLDDRVVEVNGLRGDGHAMLQECTRSASLQLLFRCTADIEHRLRTIQYYNMSRDDFDFLCWLDDTVPVRTGIHRRFVTQLPKTAASSIRDFECMICLTRNYSEDGDEDVDFGVTTLPCTHIFCTKCIMAWLGSYKARCPLCKAVVECPSRDSLPGFDDSIGCDIVVEANDHECPAFVQAHTLTIPRMMSASRDNGLRIRSCMQEMAA